MRSVDLSRARKVQEFMPELLERRELLDYKILRQLEVEGEPSVLN